MLWGYITAYSKSYDDGFESRKEARRFAERDGSVREGESFTLFAYDANEVVQEAFKDSGRKQEEFIGKTLEQL